MKREHYQHVVDTFNLTQYNIKNQIFRSDIEGQALSTHLETFYERTNERWGIKLAHRQGLCITLDIPSKQLAAEIVEYFKATEILFL